MEKYIITKFVSNFHYYSCLPSAITIYHTTRVITLSLQNVSPLYMKGVMLSMHGLPVSLFLVQSPTQSYWGGWGWEVLFGVLALGKYE